ncbi:MAG: VanZ family protein [Ferruginibacter sp.]
MKHIKISNFIPGTAWFFVVLILLCMPGDDIPSNDWIEIIYFDKWVHTGIFGLMAFLFMMPVALSPTRSRKKLQYFILIAIATSLWGLTTEFIQKFWVSGRNFDLFDWAADSLGAFTSLIICRKKFISFRRKINGAN